MSDIRNSAINFEATKVAITQDRNGFILKLSVHPNDVPEELLRSWVGSRYVVAMVEVADDGQPKQSEKKIGINRAVQSAAMLCQEEKFWKYLGEVAGVTPRNEEEARGVLLHMLDIGSRKDLATNEKAKEAFDGMRGEFQEWLRTGGTIFRDT